MVRRADSAYETLSFCNQNNSMGMAKYMPVQQINLATYLRFTVNLQPALNMTEHVSHPYRTMSIITVMWAYILILTSLGSTVNARNLSLMGLHGLLHG
jgi:hypothetical protein